LALEALFHQVHAQRCSYACSGAISKLVRRLLVDIFDKLTTVLLLRLETVKIKGAKNKSTSEIMKHVGFYSVFTVDCCYCC